MTDVGYVVAGWSITAAVFLGYWLWLRRRTRHAERHKLITAAQYSAVWAITTRWELRPNIQSSSGYPIGRNAK